MGRLRGEKGMKFRKKVWKQGMMQYKGRTGEIKVKQGNIARHAVLACPKSGES